MRFKYKYINLTSDNPEVKEFTTIANYPSVDAFKKVLNDWNKNYSLSKYWCDNFEPVCTHTLNNCGLLANKVANKLDIKEAYELLIEKLKLEYWLDQELFEKTWQKHMENKS